MWQTLYKMLKRMDIFSFKNRVIYIRIVPQDIWTFTSLARTEHFFERRLLIRTLIFFHCTPWQLFRINPFSHQHFHELKRAKKALCFMFSDLVVFYFTDAGSSIGAKGQFVSIRLDSINDNEQPDGAVALAVPDPRAGQRLLIHPAVRPAPAPCSLRNASTTV